ncbi:hypothetical protein T440DRAFT_473727 [Plenodomus tracheiphilus IPT5]|uniref:Zn(2)-C6 fungal-type domain-containing protein n=1 Tax=Plenodomus tracheiphilus IPT5 TaxID=1408161 RepID=A0A6A7AM15_9PLEO|nr:hypothetical protein T440DRAFT_473727 [Plenodomus tracheiphilus IPT5]
MFALDPSQAASSSSELIGKNHKIPLFPGQKQHASPVVGTYRLRTRRGSITSIACGTCRKRKTKCDGVRPSCSSCQTKKLLCVYEYSEDQRSTTQLRAEVRRLAEEVNGLKSIAPLLARATDRTAAAWWADEVKDYGFAHHSADEVKNALSGSIPVDIDTEGELYCTLNDIDPIPNMVDSMPGVPSSKTGRIIPQLSTSAELSYMTGNTTEGISPANPFLPGLWNDTSVDSYGWEEVLEGL